MKIAIILFNLGGPDSLKNVRPFLFNLFNDRSIIDLPNPFRFFLARFISKIREKKAQNIYSKIGGKSPLFERTQEQALALQKALNDDSDGDVFSVHIAMRYWHPRADAVVKELGELSPDKVILLPLYPQYSTTTTESSFLEFDRLADPKWDCIKINSYHNHFLFIKAHADLLQKELSRLDSLDDVIVLFSAHGIPEDVILKKNDPYQKQIEESVAAVVQLFPNIDSKLCYQSKVGPKKWLGPSTGDCIIDAAKQGKRIVVVPIAFVSDHSETLVELDIDFKELAFENGAKDFIRVASLNKDSTYIECLKDLVKNAL